MLKPADKFLIVSLLSLALLLFLQQSPTNQTATQVFVSVDGLIKYKLPRSSEPSSLIIQGVWPANPSRHCPRFLCAKCRLPRPRLRKPGCH